MYQRAPLLAWCFALSASVVVASLQTLNEPRLASALASTVTLSTCYDPGLATAPYTLFANDSSPLATWYPASGGPSNPRSTSAVFSGSSTAHHSYKVSTTATLSAATQGQTGEVISPLSSTTSSFGSCQANPCLSVLQSLGSTSATVATDCEQFKTGSYTTSVPTSFAPEVSVATNARLERQIETIDFPARPSPALGANPTIGPVTGSFKRELRLEATIPAYASGSCPDSAAYSSACSCIGFAASTQTNEAPSSIIHSTQTSTALSTPIQSSSATIASQMTSTANTRTTMTSSSMPSSIPSFGIMASGSGTSFDGAFLSINHDVTLNHLAFTTKQGPIAFQLDARRDSSLGLHSGQLKTGGFAPYQDKDEASETWNLNQGLDFTFWYHIDCAFGDASDNGQYLTCSSNGGPNFTQLDTTGQLFLSATPQAELTNVTLIAVSGIGQNYTFDS